MEMEKALYFKKSKKTKKKSYGTVSFPNGMGDLVRHLIDYLTPKIQIKTGVSISNIDEILKIQGTVCICTSLKNLLPLLVHSLPKNEVPNLLTISTITRFGETKLTKKPCFGVLFGKNEGIQALGVLCNSDIFEGRVANNLHSETWIYPKLAGGENKDQIKSILENDRATITGKREEAINFYLTTWDGVFPAYDKNLYLFNQRLDRLEAEWKSKGKDVKFYGNYRKGIGLRSIFESTMSE